MFKEIIICIIIVLIIIVGNFYIQKYIESAVIESSKNLRGLRVKLQENNNNSDINVEDINNSYKKTQQEWKNIFSKLAFFVEHTELEKVETSFTALKSYIETNKYEDAIEELDKSEFLLKHIEDKYSLNWQNIF
ncbi:MAG: DUF4363 family protein [Clostridia bacterium]|nr:DUF4363 family protein [Clostridia bacterium]